MAYEVETESTAAVLWSPRWKQKLVVKELVLRRTGAAFFLAGNCFRLLRSMRNWTRSFLSFLFFLLALFFFEASTLAISAVNPMALS